MSTHLLQYNIAKSIPTFVTLNQSCSLDYPDYLENIPCSILHT